MINSPANTPAMPQEIQLTPGIQLAKLFTEMNLQPGVVALASGDAREKTAHRNYTDFLKQNKLAAALNQIWDIYLFAKLKEASPENVSQLIKIVESDSDPESSQLRSFLTAKLQALISTAT